MTDAFHATVTRELDGTPAHVFEAFSDADQLRDWLAGEGRATVDFRVGGTFEVLMVLSGQELRYSGVYRRIEPPSLLAFTWRVGEETEESLVRVELEAAGEQKTQLTLTHTGLPNESFATQYQLAWNGFLNILAHQLEARMHHEGLR